MKVAIVTPALNAEPFVGEALYSMLDQDGAEALDIIVVDDGSSDGTVNVVEQVAAERGQIRLIRSDHQGVTRARNRALDALTPDTDLVGFLDADDFWPKGRLRQDLDFMAAEPSLQLVYGSMRMFLSRDWESDRSKGEPEGLNIRGINLGGLMLRRDFLAKVGGFDEAFLHGEDMDFLLRVFEAQPNYRILDEVRVFYRRHNTNMTHNREKRDKGLMKALARSIYRRRKLGDLKFPQGIFDAANFERTPPGW